MNYRPRRERLQAKLERLSIARRAPSLQMVYLQHDDPVPAGLDEWALGIRIEEKNLTRVE
ncbi:MAG: hypothetical protein MK221_07290 [Gemmatimonadetes bacterium]|nr:hypothetical protein [Gemmatimonadota bacterium]